ncbi:23S rRNA (pseudouridine(1915)-N(3))-methyltransferase RlmH [Rhodovulum tesquicola]|uniref:23S rRNA (pseudouridine(1915)-N(3))-methyltransferase RlmH n=1 Tax=Rhodovulum TaxID=34008 RepID=UPI001839CC3E|nr:MULTISPECIES: 23S rRNA (pseudouridine(1915)-N(3))-methyltransferase RlmH [Rhodovulum]MCO8145975.1 23S rRNA (pseudouridine(1915)-N(3))-methyltransferase RlmH [Rhodovulum tesquicola]HDR29984.1 23S rRNA (pseudouridine(1915)-N(3))-methyltransferase RlmH [Rhodovulum sp.]
MRLHLCAVGRLRSGPERALVDDYAARFDRTGRALGLGPLTVTEIEDRKGGGPAAEAALLARALPEGAALCALDERGQMLSSPDFAALLARWRDSGRSAAAFLIGGADGLDPALRARADTALSFGPMVWPHMLARAMLAEQLYRAAQILAGTPYHRI